MRILQKHKSTDEPYELLPSSSGNQFKKSTHPHFATSDATSMLTNAKISNLVSTRETNFIIKKIQGLGLSGNNPNSSSTNFNLKLSKRDNSKEENLKNKILKNTKQIDHKKKSGPVTLSARPGIKLHSDTFMAKHSVDNRKKLIESVSINNNLDAKDITRKSLQWHTHTLSENKRKISQDGAKRNRLNVNFFNRNHKAVK